MLDVVQRRPVITADFALEVDPNDAVPIPALPEIWQREIWVEFEVLAEFQGDVWISSRGSEGLADCVDTFFEGGGAEDARSWPALEANVPGGDLVGKTAHGDGGREKQQERDERSSHGWLARCRNLSRKHDLTDIEGR